MVVRLRNNIMDGVVSRHGASLFFCGTAGRHLFVDAFQIRTIPIPGFEQHKAESETEHKKKIAK